MKVGIIADIHGDAEALRLALDVLKSKNVDQIVCAGDIVDKGPDNVAAVHLLQTASIHCIAGNHDQDEDYIGSLEEPMATYLRQLPKMLRFEWENQQVLLAHASPWSDFVRILLTTERHVFKRLAREANAGVVILGHTHVPLAARVGTTWVFNPGSVCGRHTSGTRTCATLTLPDGDFELFRLDNSQPVQLPLTRIY